MALSVLLFLGPRVLGQRHTRIRTYSIDSVLSYGQGSSDDCLIVFKLWALLQMPAQSSVTSHTRVSIKTGLNPEPEPEQGGKLRRGFMTDNTVYLLVLVSGESTGISKGS